ncbi:TPA: hypothetical protein NKQ52_005071 [Vibrio parahaemolyticus]|nr:hypothetical protein [Vibrio parahaemolyticus]HCH1657831.1 hypothetical protein [Vibrio parahaemolyticus]HCH1661198.1 hypothetical protein [Vibrio parahaemolyticus]
MIGLWKVKPELEGFNPRNYEGFLYHVRFIDIDYHYIGIKKFWTKDGELSPWMHYTTSSKDVQRLIAMGHKHEQTIIRLFSHWTPSAGTVEARLINLLSQKHGNRLLNTFRYPFTDVYKINDSRQKDDCIYSENDYQALMLYQMASVNELGVNDVDKIINKAKVVLRKPLRVERRELVSKTLDIVSERLGSLKT